MTERRSRSLMHGFPWLRPAGRADALADAVLLERFTEAADDAAFEALVRRHGPMMLGVCRRVLRQAEDAQDACQAAFLVLARRARSIRKKHSLASWLHGVAFRAAANLRKEIARRRARERRMPPPAPVVGEDVSWREVQTILDEELARLCEKYQLPLILCCLEGKTRDEAAKQLGWSLGTFRRRLEYGRKLLHRRLTRRGVTLAAGLLASTVGAESLPAAPAPALLQATVLAARAIVSGNPWTSLVSERVALLTLGVLKTMSTTRLLVAAVGLFAFGMVGAGLFAFQGTGSVSEDPAIPQPPSRAAPPPAFPPPRRVAPPPGQVAPAGGQWSPAVNGLRGRLQVVVKLSEKGTPVITTYLDLKTDPSRMATTTVAIDQARLEFTVTDSAGNELPLAKDDYEEKRAPYGVLRLPHDSELHFNIAHHGAGVPRDQGGMLDLGSSAVWVFPRQAGEKYFLRGTLTIAGPQDAWTGTLELPAVQVPPPPDRSAWTRFSYQFKPANGEKIRKAIQERYANARGIAIMVQGIRGAYTVQGRGEPDKVKELLELLKELDK